MIWHLLAHALKLKGYRLEKIQQKHGGYIDVRQTVAAAQERGISVREYVEQMWDQQGCTERVVDCMRQAGCLAPGQYVVEIGPGTGRYLDLILHHSTPRQYDIYETDLGWAEWLEQTYPVVRHPADGISLKQTPDKICDLVHAHGVFVYLPFLHCFEYFIEMMRVCAPGGFVVFDYYSAQSFDTAMIMQWLQSGQRYPVVLSDDTVLEFFQQREFTLVHSFENKHGAGFSRYVIFRNKGA